MALQITMRGHLGWLGEQKYGGCPQFVEKKSGKMFRLFLFHGMHANGM